METASLYDSAFYQWLSYGSLRSAKAVLPLVQNWIQPRSIIDVGCGTGAWLSVWQELGVEQFLGVDGDSVNFDQLLIPHEKFLVHDLVQPLPIDQRFELAMSLEVVEHLPQSVADAFVEKLTHLSDVVLFSAAIPYQGGTGHLNEQWTSEWIGRFERLGYLTIDALRPQIWENPNVEPWYAQNLLLFIRRDRVSDYPQIPHTPGLQRLNVVHPQVLHNSVSYYTLPLRTELEQVKAELAQTQQALEAAQAEIGAMRSSKFWRLRTYWMRLKQGLKPTRL